MRLPGLSEYSDLAASRYSVPCTLFGVWSPLRFSPRGLLRLKLMVRRILSQTWTPLQRPVEIPTVLLLSRAASRPSSLEVPRPFSVPKNLESVCRPYELARLPHRAPSPHSHSQTLKGLFFNVPRGLVSCHSRSWGSYPSRFFPSEKLSPARHQVFPSRCFSEFPLRQ